MGPKQASAASARRVTVRQLTASIPGFSRRRHPHILRLYAYFHDQKRIFLVLEYALKGELFKQLQKERRFSEKKSSRVSLTARLERNSDFAADIFPFTCFPNSTSIKWQMP